MINQETAEELLECLKMALNPLDAYVWHVEECNRYKAAICKADSEIRSKPEYKFDIDRKDLYEFTKPELRLRTRDRLIEMAECGMEEFPEGGAQFQYTGVMSGLYIEKVWGLDCTNFKSYMGWAKGLINKSKKGE